ncbi:MAG: BlaI/MecI/CopY family transcriptional regulator [Bacteroidota bacterium]
MGNQEKLNPTPSELAILQILWENGPNAVKMVHEKLAEEKEVVYTTTLKTMQVMWEKGMLTREAAGRKHIYQAIVQEDETQSVLLDKFLHKTFGGSALRMVMKALGNYKTSAEEIKALKKYIKSIEKSKDQ